MARNTENIDYRIDYYRGAAKIYFNEISKTIIRIGDLKNENGLILDYGCGVGHLKKALWDRNVIGYDIIPELSDVVDYQILRPQKIVLSGVLEHLYLDEIEKLLQKFIGMNPLAELLVFLPTENFVSRVAMLLANQKNAHDDHVSKYREINRLIEKYYFLERRKYLFFRMAQISRYSPAKKDRLIR